MGDSSSTKIGLLLESKTVPYSKAQAVRKVVDELDAELALAAINEAKSSADTGDENRSTIGRVKKLVSDIASGQPYTVVNADYLVGQTIGESAPRALPTWTRSTAIDGVLDEHDVDVRYYTPERRDGVGCELPDDLVETFDESVDLILNFEHNVLKGDILHASKYGVLSTHAGDLRKYRGRPPRVWQYLNGEKTIGRTIQILTPDLDGGIPVLIWHVPIEPDETLWDLQLKHNRILPEMYVRAIQVLQQHGQRVDEPVELGELTLNSSKQHWPTVLRILSRHWRARLTRLYRTGSLTNDREPRVVDRFVSDEIGG